MMGYYILRPVREGFGVENDKGVLKYLFLGTFAGTLVAVPLFSRLVSITPRQRFLPFVFRFFSVNLVIFWALLISNNATPWPGRVFYCWLSVYSVFTVSVLWSYLVDLFNSEQTKELFGPIAVGMSTGAIAGSLITGFGIDAIGRPGLLLLPVIMAELVLLAIRRIEFHATRGEFSAPGDKGRQQEEPVRGNILDGVRIVAQSRYLLLICLLLFCSAGVSTVFYFAQNNFVRDVYGSDQVGMAKFFANMNLATQGVTIFMQAFLVSRIIKAFGMKTALCVLPVVGLIGLVVLGLHGNLAVLIPCYILMKGTSRGVASPTKQMLFAIVDRRQKYKSKNFIDTVIVRGSDVVVIWALSYLQSDTGFGVGKIVLVALPLAVLWVGVAFFLGGLHKSQSETFELRAS